jgi:signal transduction histidine kinase
VQDQAEKKKLETQFYRAQRMESIGALAGGIAHDLNNVLTPILIAAQFLEQATEAKERAEMVATITSCAQRGSDMVKRILSFARGTAGHSDRLQMEDLCAEMARLAQATFPRDIRVFSKSIAALPPVLGNTTQLHQVLMNLCVNARDAMPDGGTLTISTEAISLENYSVKSELEPVSGNYVVLSVADTGAGIPAEMLDKVFEPFFTTKEQGKGTGLGLPTVLGIVKNHGGFVEVLSEAGQGTTFKVYLPIASIPSAVHASTP